MLHNFKTNARILSMDVKFDKYSLIVDGERKFLKSGTLHYFRVFGEKEWRDRLSKMKAGGYNCVDLYLCWSFHNPKKDFWDFEGFKDIRTLFSVARDLGLYMIVRPGPYINGEISAGGLPYWLLKEKDVIPRNRIDGDYVYSPSYMKYLKDWYCKVLPVVKDFDNLIAVQIENEYSTNGGENEYIKELYDIVRSCGINVPVFHNDAYIAGLYADDVDIYACDIYPYINPKTDWKKETYAFDTLDNLEEVIRSFKDDSPLFIMEMQSGWYDKWLGYGYERIREDMGEEHINIMTKTALSQGVTMFNHYMCAGGTNILDMSSDEVYTSYDFASPISELGVIKDNFKKAKEINYFLDGFDFTQTEAKDVDFEIPANCFAKVRKDLTNDCDWLFLRNFNTCETMINGVNMDSFDMKILPRNLKLRAVTIVKSGTEIFTRLQDSDREVVFVFSDEKNSITIEDENGVQKTISADREDFEGFYFGADNDCGKKTSIVFITRQSAKDCWKLNNALVFGAKFAYPDGKIALENETLIRTFDLKNGFVEHCFAPDIQNKRIKLTDFDVYFCANEIEHGYDYSNWKKIKHNEDFTLQDTFSSDVYSEFVWYKGKISNRAREIAITARHIFAIYINGYEILNRNSYKHDNLATIDEHIVVDVDPAVYSGEENEITVLVQNLGFDRGFSNNIGSPRGLVYFKTDTNEYIDWRIRGRITLDKREPDDSQAPYLACLEKRFEIPKEYFREDVFAPFVLDMEKTPFRRATIFLNDVKIGRYIRHNANQSKFYLPKEFLKKENEIKIVTWEKSHRIKGVWDFKNYLKDVIINIETHKVYQLF